MSRPRPKSPSPQNEPETESTATPHPLALQQTIPYGANMPLQNLTPVSGTSQMVQGYNGLCNPPPETTGDMLRNFIGAPPDPLPYGYVILLVTMHFRNFIDFFHSQST